MAKSFIITYVELFLIIKYSFVLNTITLTSKYLHVYFTYVSYHSDESLFIDRKRYNRIWKRSSFSDYLRTIFYALRIVRYIPN